MSSSHYNSLNTTAATTTSTNTTCSDVTNASSDRSSDGNLTNSRVIPLFPQDGQQPMNISDTDTHTKAVLASHSPPILSALSPSRKGSSNPSYLLTPSPPSPALLYNHASISAPPATLCTHSPRTDSDMQPLDLSLRPSRGDHSSKRVGHTMEEHHHHHRQPHYQQSHHNHHHHHHHRHDHRTAVSQAKYCSGTIGFGNSRGYRLSPYPMDGGSGSRASPPAMAPSRSPPLSRMANSPLFSAQRQTPSPAYYSSSNSCGVLGGLNSSGGLNGSVPVLGQAYYLPLRPPSTSGNSSGSSSIATTESSSFQLLTTSNNVLNELPGSSALFRPYDGSSDSAMNHVSSSMEDAPTPPPSREVEEEQEEEEEEPTYMDLDSATPRCVYAGTSSSTCDSQEYSQRKDGMSQFSPHLHGNHTDAITPTSSSPTSSLSFSISSSSPSSSSSTSTSSSSRKISPFKQIQSSGTYALRPYRNSEARIFSKTRSESETGDINDDNPARRFYNLPMPAPAPPPPTSVSEPSMDQQNHQEEALNCESIADIRLYPGHPQSSLARAGGGGHHDHRLQFSADSSSGPHPPPTLPSQLTTSLLAGTGAGCEVGTSSTESPYPAIPQCGEVTSGRKSAPYHDVNGGGGRTTDSESTYPPNEFESPPDNKENAMVGSSTTNTSSLPQASSSSTPSSTATTRTSFFQVATDVAGRKYRSDWEQAANIAATKRSNKSLLSAAAGKEDCQKISLLDFWISKTLMERVEAPSKPCNANIRPIMVAGQKKIRLRLIDLIELQVELSLKA